MRRLLPLLLALLSGCAAPGWNPSPEAPAPVTVDPPADGGGFAACASPQARLLAVPLEARVARDDQGLGPGIHRLDNRTLLWVHAVHRDSLREDRISRLNEVQVKQEPDGLVQVCTRVELVAPVVVDPEARSFVVAAVFEAPRGYPPGPMRAVVNWVAGCPCDPLPRGNATATWD